MAASLRDGLDENLNGSIAHYTRNVERWVASALSGAKDRFRKLRGHRDMKALIAGLNKRVAAAQPVELKAA